MKRKRASWLPLMSSMRDVGPVLYGECQRNMDDDDRRLQICSAVQLLPILEAEGVSAAEQRERLHQYYDEGVAALQLYRQRKGDLRPLLALLKSDLSDGAKIAGVLMMLCGLEKTPDIAAATGRPMRTVERHCAENCVDRAKPTQFCVPLQIIRKTACLQIPRRIACRWRPSDAQTADGTRLQTISLQASAA